MVTKQAREISTPKEPVQYIRLDDLLPNPYQPDTRIEVDPETAKKFALSIQEHGLIQMPVVRPGKDGKYEIGDGWLRRAGFLFNLKEFGLQDYAEMPCVVKSLTDQQMADMVMEANTVRKDLNPIELAKFYKRYLEDFKIPQIELARRHNCSQGEIANTIRLLELPEDIQQKIISQEISETHGRQLLRLNYNSELQKEVLDRSIKDGYSVNQLSNEVARTMYYKSNNIDPDDYPSPEFDVKDCEKCPHRVKLGTPYSNERKRWRCLDTACFEKKAKQAEKERIKKLEAEIAAAKKEAGDDEKGGVLDLDKLTWRDYQCFESYRPIDNPKECESCPRRAVGKLWNGRTETVCIDVKCYKAKEKVYQDKAAAEAREEEKRLTQRVKAACDKLSDESTAFKVITDYLLMHSRKDTRERFARMYGIPDPGGYFASGNEVDTIQKTVALVLTLERYEGEKGMFNKMLADLEGTGAEVEKQIAAFREKHCKTCRHDKGGCKNLIRVYLKGECYAYWKKLAKDEEGVGAEIERLADEDMDRMEQELDAVKDIELAEAEANSNELQPMSDAEFATRANAKPWPPNPLAELVIHVAHDKAQEHIIEKGNFFIRCRNLKAGILNLTEQLGWSADANKALEALNNLPASSNRDLLIGILEANK